MRLLGERLITAPGARFEAYESNTTYRPSAVIRGVRLKPFACVPSLATLMRLICRFDAAARTARTTYTRPMSGPSCTRPVAPDASGRPAATTADTRPQTLRM